MNEERLERIDERLRRIEESSVRLENLITGNGTPERGLIVKLDRLEQQAESNRWTMRTALTALAVAVAGMVLKLIAIAQGKTP